MAVAKEDVNTKELSFIFKSLGEQDNETGRATSYFLEHHISKVLSDTSTNGTVFEFSGSAAENVRCYDSDYCGDVDLMIFPNADDVLIHDELIEYLPDNPLHVRIKGIDHPVLQSCLLEDTEYVATSALKNFHPALYRSSSVNFADFFTLALKQIASFDELVLNFGHCKTNRASPAVTVSLNNSSSSFFGSLGDCIDMGELGKIVPADWEWLAVGLCGLRGVEYTREHAEVLEDICQLRNEGFVPPVLPRSPNVTQDVNWNDRSEKIKARIRDIERQSQWESGRKTEFTGKPIPKRPKTLTEIHEDVDYKSEKNTTHGVLHGNQSQSQREPPLLQKDELTKEEENKEAWGVPRISKHLFQHMVGKVPERKEYLSEKKRTRFKDIDKTQLQERIIGGIDFVPAFRSRGWPKVAREWIRRERKWPTPDIVDRVVQEGFHLVVKSPKEGGNPGCDFRISFSHAEYLLSQEMNDIQRECYRCLKKYHRAYLSTKAKSLVTFHLKNILLRTIEETGAEMWTESNRVECMMKLFGNLLEALRKKNLWHFFVRSYNLFGVDYIERPEILVSLAEKVKQIMENPIEFAKGLVDYQENSNRVKNKTEDCIPSDKSTPTSTKTTEQVHKVVGQILPKGGDNAQSEQMEKAHQGSSSRTTYRYHDLRDTFLATSKELINLAFNEADFRLEALDSLERSLVEDLRELERDPKFHVTEFAEMFQRDWEVVCMKVWMSAEPDIRRRVLLGIQGVIEIWKFKLKQHDFAPENEAAIIRRMFDATADNPFDLNHIISAGAAPQFFHMFLDSLRPRPVQLQKVDMDGISLD